MFRTLLSLAGLVAFLLIWWFLPRTEEEPVDGLDSHLVERSSETRSMDPVSMCDDTNGSLARDVVLGPGSKAPDQAVPVTERAATLRARLLWQSDGGPVAQARVEVLLGEGSAATSRRREVVTDDAGVFELTGLPRGKVLVHCFLGGWTEGTLNPSETTNLELHLEDGVTIQGVVVDERGVGIPSAAIFLSSEGHANLGEFVTRTLSDGTFRLRTATQYALIGAVAAGYVPSDHVLLETGAAEVRDVRLTMRPGGGSVFGTVTDEDGGSVPNARLVFSTGPRRLSEDPGGILTGKATRFFATSDAQGHYEVASLQPGDVTYACLAFGHATAFESVQVRNGEHKRVDIRLQPEAIVEGRIRKANGEPIENTWVFVLPEAQDRTDLEEAHRFTAPTDAHGRYRIVGLPQGASRANVDTTSDGSERATLQLLAGEVTTWNVDLALRYPLAGVLVDANGAPLAGWTVVASSARSMRDYRGGRATVAADGAFEIRGLIASTHRLSAIPRVNLGCPALVIDDVLPPRSDLVLQVPDAARPTATIRGVVRDGMGTPLPHAEVYLETERARGGHIFRTSALGEFEIGPLPGGEYALNLDTTGFPKWRRAGLRLEPDHVLDLGVIELTRGGLVEVALQREVECDVSVTIRRNERWLQTLDLESGRGTSRALAPGSYRVQISGDRVRMHAIDVEVREGETTHCTLPVEPGLAFVLAFTAPLGDDGPTSIDCVVEQVGGGIVERRTCDMHPHVFARDLETEERTGRHPIGETVFALAFGTYVVHVSHGTWSERSTITLGPDVEPPTLRFHVTGS